MIFPPLMSFFMLVLLGLALILLPFLLVGAIGSAFAKLGLSPGAVFVLLIATLAGSLVNIPLTTLKSMEVEGDRVIRYYGLRVRIPQAQRRHTVLAVNLGGAVIPTLLSLYLLGRMEFCLGTLVLLGLVTLVMFFLARPVRGLGIAVPGLAPPVLAVLGAFLLCPVELRAPSAYVASTMGTLIGADLLKLREITRLGAPVASIGGAGTFDAVFLSGIIAVLLS
ncbi:MAG: DUF1614 domain-containing protein [Deltaproteobacteria bacterium]|nr:DUF1614 domain-containing protein [Deltaproteobacteria bacterium]